MKSISPHPSATFEQAVHGLRDPDRHSLHAARESPGIFRFDEQVQVICLDAVMQNAESVAARSVERVLDGREGSSEPERGNAGSRPQRDMGRTVALVRSPTRMRNHSPLRCALSAGAFPPPTPRRESELALSRHLDSAHMTN
jgi:hypothetical protein